MGSIGGTLGGRFFGFTGPDVNVKAPPGYYALHTPTLGGYLGDVVTLRYLFLTPNFIWLLIACAAYVLLPPPEIGSGPGGPLEPLSLSFFTARFTVWLSVVLTYFTFWHVCLYWLDWGKRPFIPNRPYRLSKVAHNIFYTVVGIAVWTGMEAIAYRLWMTGSADLFRIPFTYSNKKALGSGSDGTYDEWATFLFWVLAIPLWRDVHFYLGHRFLHFRFLYRQIHSLHHRNTDPEPFAGLCMHPLEHIYYFSVLWLPLLFCRFHPFLLYWMGVHVMCAPAAGHSGYEDHWQADIHHYYHHRYFECNYSGGVGSSFLDVWSGTFFPGPWKEKGKTKDDKTPLTVSDDKARVGWPSLEFVFFLFASVAMVLAPPLLCVTSAQQMAGFLSPWVGGAIAGFGPCILCMVLYLGRYGASETFSQLFKVTGGQLLHFVLGVLCCLFPLAIVGDRLLA
jgi:sterol desaturase/sphingolipid hydroxylase (fatty acid hydroxylase superfamily)